MTAVGHTRLEGRRLAVDHIRRPSRFDPTSAAYKEWLHLNLVDHATQVTGLLNLSLHGPPDDPRSRAIAAALLHIPGRGWVGNLAIAAMRDAVVGPSSIALGAAAISVDHAHGLVHVSVEMPQHGLSLRARTAATTQAVTFDQPMPLGAGWISWYVVPHLTAQGHAVVDGARIDLDGASAYHDHNWGRWHWGDDVGWDWGCFLAPDALSFVLARTSDRLRRRPGEPILLVNVGHLQKTFRGGSVRVVGEGHLEVVPRRLPGPLAALHTGRGRPHLPAILRIFADDGVDAVQIVCSFTAAAQLITGDPIRRGYSFLHESTGAFMANGRLAGTRLDCEGLAVVEHVD